MILLMMLAVALGAVTVVLLSARDFHAPWKVAEIRYAVLPERYWFALVVYVTVALSAYLLVLYVTWVYFVVTMENDLLTGLPAALAAALTATVLILILTTRLPIISRIVGALRRFMHGIARYPKSAETVTWVISWSPFKPIPEARAEIASQLRGYGVPSKIVAAVLANDRTKLSPAATQMLEEVCTLHLRFAQLRTERRFAKFIAARAELMGYIEREYSRLFRRTARAILLTEDLMPSNEVMAELVLDISDFAAEEAEPVRGKYQRLLAEAALSCLGHGKRAAFIRSFGYDVQLPSALPLAPLAIVFVLDFLFAIGPSVSLPLPDDARMEKLSLVVAGLAHAFAFTAAIVFAIYPKVVSTFARPSLFSLPWQSYILFGLGSYLAGTVALHIVLNLVTVPESYTAKENPLAASLLYSTLFLVTTVVLSILLDLRLRDDSDEYRRGRIRDGVVLMLATGGTMVFVQLGDMVLAWQFRVATPELKWYVRPAFTVLFAGFGFVVGYLIPSYAEAHIGASKVLLSEAGKSGKLGGLVTREYQHPPAAQPAE
jgi:hypothetical protein